jgi:phosphoribosylglycinamide formyltransferase-1
MSARPRLAILGSGKGSNFAALLGACTQRHIAADIVLVLSDVPEAGILAQARAAGLPAKHLPPGGFRTKLDEAAEAAYSAAIRAAAADWVLLAGFMRVLKAPFLAAVPGRIVNIHPSLLPAFPGLEAWRQALDHGVKWTGCTVHLVDQGVDSGPILGQAAVPVRDEDTPATLHARIQEAERRLYPAVVRDLVAGKISVRGRQARGFAGLADHLADHRPDQPGPGP